MAHLATEAVLVRGHGTSCESLNPALGDTTPLETLHAGAYEKIAGIAEDLIDPPFT